MTTLAAPTPDSPATRAPAAPAAGAQTVRAGVVNYINTLPLIDGLAGLAGLQLRPEVPSRLVELLASGEVDIALCSAVDVVLSPVPLLVVPVGMLGCAGETLTVRLFARTPLEQVRTLAADQDSHTSRALAQLLLRERFGTAPRVIDYDRRRGPRDPEADAMLLIGDKVINDAPDARTWPHQLDLGEAWHAWTGLPFVFATWFIRADAPEPLRARLRTVARVLDHQRRHNRERIDGIVACEAAAHGWPAATARRYLRELLRFDLDAPARQGLELFLQRAHAAGVIPAPAPLRTFDW
ncbi:MAG: menaquinone biosynthesis protein [Phycisphaerales bacterium]